VTVEPGTTVAAALLGAGLAGFRKSVTGYRVALSAGMGITVSSAASHQRHPASG